MRDQGPGADVFAIAPWSVPEPRAKQEEKGLVLFPVTLDQGMAPNAVTYIALFSTCGQGQRHKGPWSSFQVIRDLSLGPDVFTCSALISFGAKGPKGRQSLGALPGDA